MAIRCRDSPILHNAPPRDSAQWRFHPLLSCYDLTRPFPSPSSGCQSPHSTLFTFLGHTDVKELAMYVQDTITKRNWSFNLGIRGDLYNGLTTASQAEPRVGFPTTSRRQTRFCAPPTRVRWRRRSMRTWCCPAPGATPVIAAIGAVRAGASDSRISQ